MRRRRIRAELSAQAESAGLGRVVRYHREIRETAWTTVAVIALALAVLAAIPGGIAVIVLAVEEDSPLWRWLVLGWMALVWPAVGLLWWDRVRSPGDRLWFAAAERGLLVRSPDRPDSPTAIRWSTAQVTQNVLTWREGGTDRTLEIPSVTGHPALLRALEHGAPVPVSVAARVAGAGGRVLAGSVTALVVWLVGIPAAADVVLGEEPDDLTDFSRMCEGGDAFGRAAPYRPGRGTHPIAVYDGVFSYPVHTEGPRPRRHASDDRLPPESVELVGCLRLVGTDDSSPVAECHYTEFPGGGEHTEVWYRGRYRLDVHEARTGRKVDSLAIDGDTGHECVERKWSRADFPARVTDETSPREQDFATVLAPLVDGGAS